MVQRETRGRGVDLVLNSLAEEKLQASVRCLAKSGIFLEIGKFDLMNESALDLELFRREATFCGVHLDRIFRADPNSKRRIMKLLADAMEAGAVKPLPRSTFGVEQVEEAFRFMASGGHIGKVLVKVREEGLCRVSSAVPKYYCETEGCCVVAGGLGGFGLELVDWLVKRGARKIVLSSRSGIKSGYQGYRIRYDVALNGSEFLIICKSILVRGEVKVFKLSFQITTLQRKEVAKRFCEKRTL